MSNVEERGVWFRDADDSRSPPRRIGSIAEPDPYPGGMTYRITAVCLGNICRSPMAEAVLRVKVAEAGLAAVVDSAGTAGWHEGHDADSRALRTLHRYGYPLSHGARQFQRQWFGSTDLVLAMDQSNYVDLRRLAHGLANAPARIHLLRSFDPNADTLDVPDPFYGGEEGFEDVLRMIEAAADGVIAHVANDLAKRP